MPEAVFVVPGAAAASWWSTITAMCPCILWIAFALVLLVLRSVTAHIVDGIRSQFLRLHMSRNVHVHSIAVTRQTLSCTLFSNQHALVTSH